jgi:hypothetical protein
MSGPGGAPGHGPPPSTGSLLLQPDLTSVTGEARVAWPGEDGWPFCKHTHTCCWVLPRKPRPGSTETNGFPASADNDVSIIAFWRRGCVSVDLLLLLIIIKIKIVYARPQCSANIDFPGPAWCSKPSFSSVCEVDGCLIASIPQIPSE